MGLQPRKLSLETSVARALKFATENYGELL